MATIANLKVGQVLFDSYREKMGNTARRHTVIAEVKILEIDLEAKTVLAVWKDRPPRIYQERFVTKWRVKRPNKPRTLI
jgi:hypothetical protein